MSALKLFKFILTHPLNRGKKIAAVIRFLKWQISSRLFAGDVVHPWIGGSKFLVRKGETGLTGNIYTGLCEFSDMGFILHFLRQEDCFVDVGANAGSYTIVACAVVGAAGYALEPVPLAYQRLSENIRLNHLEQRVKYLNVGVAEHSGEVQFSINFGPMNHVLIHEESSTEAVTVKVSALDDIVCDEMPRLIKIDVEGYELRVLEGGGRLLSDTNLKAVIVELNGSGQRYGCSDADVLSLMSEYGFSPYSYNPENRSLVTLAGYNKKSDNTLFIRDLDFVAERLRTAESFAVHGKVF